MATNKAESRHIEVTVHTQEAIHLLEQVMAEHQVRNNQANIRRFIETLVNLRFGSTSPADVETQIADLSIFNGLKISKETKVQVSNVARRLIEQMDTEEETAITYTKNEIPFEMIQRKIVSILRRLPDSESRKRYAQKLISYRFGSSTPRDSQLLADGLQLFGDATVSQENKLLAYNLLLKIIEQLESDAADTMPLAESEVTDTNGDTVELATADNSPILSDDPAGSLEPTDTVIQFSEEDFNRMVEEAIDEDTKDSPKS